MKFFRKMDEMEVWVSFRAMRLAWAFENLALLVWAAVALLKGGVPTAIVIVLGQNFIYFAGYAYLSRKLSASQEDEDEK